MSSQFPSNNPTGYVGILPTNPGQNWIRDRDPLSTDFRGYTLGDRWIHIDPSNPSLAAVWTLVNKNATAGTWLPLGGGLLAVSELLLDDANLVSPVAGVVALTGDATQGLSTFEPIAGTAEITIADATSAQKGVVTVDSTAHSVLIGTAVQSSITSTATGTAGQFFISGGAAADPSWTSYVNTDAAGIISMPSQSASSAYRSANLANQTGDLTEVTVLFDAEDYDIQGEYTPGTGIFKATKAGIYIVNAVVGLTGVAVGNNVGNLSIWINANKWWQAQYNPGAVMDAANQVSMSGSVALKLAANDQVKVTVQVGGGAKVVGILGATNIHTEFQVTKVA